MLKLMRYSTDATFYRRELPSLLTSLQSSKGKTFFENALKAGNAESFFALVGNFSTQSEPAFCGLSSLSMSLNALEIDPKKRWKGVWRWFSDDMLECAPENVKTNGMTFDQVHQVALCNGLDVVAKRGDQISFSEFLKDIDNITSRTDKQMIVSFSRKTLSQTGDGHFSPIGAISHKDNQVLVMDTARFKYPSYFVDSKLLFESMLPVDTVSGLPRGYLIVSRMQEEKTLPLCRITAKHGDINNLKIMFIEIGKLLQQQSSGMNAEAVITCIFDALPKSDNHHFYTNFAQGLDLAGDLKSKADFQIDVENDLNTLFLQIRSHPLFSIVANSLSSSRGTPNTGIENLLATLFLLSIPRLLIQEFPDWATRTVLNWQDPTNFKGLRILDEEITRMRKAWSTAVNSHCHDQLCCQNKISL